MKIASDRFDQYKKKMEEPMDLEKMMECEPVDLYGKRVFKTKNDNNLKVAASDIQEFYDLTGEAGLS